jgi:NADH dehydrogenase/NADH:ubiquinone oxidoreductase subunit G
VTQAAETVSLTIDDVELSVPKGTGLVEAALAAGIEIPVFCYEPRLGPPVGACRMCLCEIEGMPKAQAACTLTVQDGMIVRTALTSAKAADAQNATLEFILVNHPLDCPVCDKGGECPLQDLTFRYGPGATRMFFPKRTFEKPVPVSPTIALDRERCILCYRCTRFSSNVAEDGELVAVNRGSQSLISTFDGEPYRGRFSGNVVELCPVGALTSTQYRFEARPWEIQTVPTICGMCPVGCNISVTTREGKVKRILSRNHPEVDAGWLCDKGRFAFSHLNAPDRVTEPRVRASARRFEPISWDDALGRFERLLRAAGTHVVTALSGSETVEQAYALGKLLRGLGAHTALVTEAENARCLDAYRAPLSALADADLVLVLGDEPVDERAPVAGLWLRLARRNGARLLYDVDEDAVREAKNPVLVWSGADGEMRCAEIAARLGISQAFFLPLAPNARGVGEAWAAASDAEDAQDPEPIKLLVISGDEALANADVRALAEQAENVVAIAMFANPARGLVDLLLPATGYLERDGTSVNLEGRLQRLRRAVIPPAPDELVWLAQLARRFGIDLSPYPSAVFSELSGLIYGGIAFSDVGEHAPLYPRQPEAEPPPQPEPEPTVKGLRLVAYRPLFSGAAVERVPELQFQRAPAELELSRDDAQRLGVLTGDTVDVRSNGTSQQLRARVTDALRAGVVRASAEHVEDLQPDVEVTRA